MNMQEHILAAMHEEFDQWEAFIATLTPDQFNVPVAPETWSIKDIVAHVYAWQQRSIARLEAALANREPIFPRWHAEMDPEELDNTDQINQWIYQVHRHLSWDKVHESWQTNFLKFLDLGAKFSALDFINGDRYAWLKGYSLADVFLGSYEHHYEHRSKLLEWQAANQPAQSGTESSTT